MDAPLSVKCLNSYTCVFMIVVIWEIIIPVPVNM